MAGIVLGAVFVAAGMSKVVAHQSWPSQAAGLGVPMWLALLVPWLELVVGATVAVGLVRPGPVIVAMGILVVFTALIVIRLAQGRHPPCACFGSWSARPLSSVDVARNVGLLVLAAVALTA
ncbi:hypothetical protein BH24ACT5_BH24ACT5_32270 [soil metagenome]